MAEHEPFDVGVIEDVNRPAIEGSTFGANCNSERKALVSDVITGLWGEADIML